MGSPETCPTCGSDDVLDRRMAPWALDLSDEMNPKTITKLCRNAWHDTPTPPAPADVATDGPNSPGAVYDACHRATAPADDARPMVTGGALIKFDRRADDAGGAEASDRAWAVRIVTAVLRKQYGHVVKYGHDLVAYEIVATLLPLPARDDAVEEAMAPGCHGHVALWDAINAYSAACGGHPTRGGGARMDAVVRVEKALRAALRRAKGGDK